MQRSKIEWTDFTSNPLQYRDAHGNVVWACIHKSAGCLHCYAEALAKRYRRGGPFNVPTTGGVTPFLNEDELHHMLTYKPASGKMCFVGDMTDIFGEWVPFELLDKLFAVFALRPDVTWQILTKRPERMREYLGGLPRPGDDLAALEEDLILRWGSAAGTLLDGPWIWNEGKRFRQRIEDFIDLSYGFMPGGDEMLAEDAIPFPLPNVWLGVSVEDQKTYKDRVLYLANTPAAVRFVSFEPLLEGIGDLMLDGIFGGAYQWAIVGGESGPGARPMHPDWARSVRDQCQAAGVAFFFKQWGEWAPSHFSEQTWEPTATTKYHYFEAPEKPYKVWRVGKKAAGRLLDGREWSEYPREAVPA